MNFNTSRIIEINNLEIVFTINKYVSILTADLKQYKDYIKYMHIFIHVFSKVNVNLLILEVSTLWVYFT